MCPMGAFLVLLLQLAVWVFIARALLSWFRIGPDNPLFPLVDAINRGTEPVLAPLRRVLPQLGGLDLSVIVVIIAIRAFLIPLAAQL